MARQAFKARIHQFELIRKDGSAVQIDPMLIKYILVEYNYLTRHMPVIYLSLSVTEEMYTMFITEQQTNAGDGENVDNKAGQVALIIERFNANRSESSLYQNMIFGYFHYIPSTSNPNYTQVLNEDSNSQDVPFRTLTLALLSMNLMNNSKTSFNGILGEIDQETLIAKALENMVDAKGKPMECVIMKPKYNAKFDTFIVPPLTSRNELIDYFFKKNPFYDTNYEFFMDFQRCYLRDWTGEAVDAGDGEPTRIIISIQQVTDPRAYYEGVEKLSDSYLMYLNPANTNLSLNKTSDNVANQMVFVDDTGTVEKVDLNVNNAIGSSVKQTFRRGGSAALYKNNAENDAVILEIMKENVNAELFNPNMSIKLENYDGYDDYNGDYCIMYKKQVISNNNGEFGIAVILGLRKITNIVPIGSEQTAKAVQSNQGAAARYMGAVREPSTQSHTSASSNYYGPLGSGKKKQSASVNSNREKSRAAGVIKLNAGDKAKEFKKSKDVLPLTAPERILPKVIRTKAKNDTNGFQIDLEECDVTKKKD